MTDRRANTAMDPVSEAVAILAILLRGRPEDAHLDALVAEIDRLREIETAQAALDRAAADMAVRDDLAREVGRAWTSHHGRGASSTVGSDLRDALDRLAAAHGEDR